MDLYLEAGKREAALRLIKNLEMQMATQDKLDITDAYLAMTSRFTRYKQDLRHPGELY